MIEAVVVNVAVAALALGAKLVRPSAAWGGLLVGLVIYAGAGRGGFAVLLGFFAIGVLLTKLGYARKAAQGLAEPNEGRRGSEHALANGGTAALLALAMIAWPAQRTGLAVAFTGAFAAALADTAGSEMGQLWGRRTISPVHFRRVPPGTEGAVSVEGTLAGLVASAVLGVLGAGVGLYPWAGVPAVSFGGFIGSLVESMVGSVPRLRRAGHMAFNFGNTVVGALAASGLYRIMKG
jgi:uncharacterized protein (TIGR00297 family)